MDAGLIRRPFYYHYLNGCSYIMVWVVPKLRHAALSGEHGVKWGLSLAVANRGFKRNLEEASGDGGLMLNMRQGTSFAVSTHYSTERERIVQTGKLWVKRSVGKQIPTKKQDGCEAGLNYYPGLSLRRMFSSWDCYRGAELEEIKSTFRNGRLL